MGGQDSSISDHSSNASPESFSGAGSPLSLLIFLHKAVRDELAELRSLASGRIREFTVAELRRRLEFLRSVYSYHCAAEDEVIFLALDAYVENIAGTYSLEHKSIENTFEDVFACLNGLPNDEKSSNLQLPELLFHIGVLQESIRQHMIKEEEQVFPLLMRQFSVEEQASLVWQFICSVPVILMEELVPWISCFLSANEQMELKLCIRKVVPGDKLLQEVVISWLDKNIQQPAIADVKYDISKNVSETLLHNTHSCNSSQRKQDLLMEVGDVLCHGLLLWHCAIRCELKEILDKIVSKKHSNLASFIFRINFIMDVLMFYSNTLEKIFYPLLEEISSFVQSLSYNPFSHRDELKELYQILYDTNKINMENPKFMETFYSKVEAVVLATSEHLSFHETEVFPLITKMCVHKTQQELIFRSLRMLPLGLLKCVITWFSSHLPKDNLRSILCGIKLSGFLEESFASLLHEWIRMGYSGKTTIQDLEEMFNGRVSYVRELNSEEDAINKLKYVKSRHCYADSSRSLLSSSLSKRFHLTKKHGTLYSSGINLLIFTSGMSKSVHPSSGCPVGEISTNKLDMRPMDNIFYFHKALKKELGSLVLDTTKLTQNLEVLLEFCQRFHLVQSLYKLHSEMKDEIAFPALESRKTARNLTGSYYIDHKLEAECFNRISGILEEMSELYHRVTDLAIDHVDPAMIKYHELCLKLQESCKSLTRVLNDHIDREEIELWTLFREYISIEEQEKILGLMLGRTRVEVLQEMIVWLMAALTPDELHAVMTSWSKATKYTMFGEWLEEWGDGLNICAFAKEQESNICPSPAIDSLKIATKHRSVSVSSNQGENLNDESVKLHNECNTAKMVKKMEGLDMDSLKHKSSKYLRHLGETKEKRRREARPIDDESKCPQMIHKVQHENKILSMHQVELEAAIRKVSQDSSLTLQEKSRIIQNLMTSHWIAAQPPLDCDNVITSEPGKLPGQFPSYRDNQGSVFGCKHYKQNCKLVASCCNKLFTCRRCHDEVSDHLLDRKSTTQMMCMKCLEVQPIGSTCSTPSCNDYSMAGYYCKICRLFDDEREIYHCPYCNICRVGKGLGIDYFHCMKCNACMGRSISVHSCREKCFEDKCPICHEDMFTSSTPIKGLACGHLMHSTCFQEYTCMHYTCPVCSKSLGNMQVYFQMLDALLAEEKIPDDISCQTQAILCNDCEKKGLAPFHWSYHKCPFCGSYNTRLW